MSRGSDQEGPQMVEADPVTPIGRSWKKHFESVCHQTSWLESLVFLNNSRARVAIGGGADTGAGKVFLSLFLRHKCIFLNSR